MSVRSIYLSGGRMTIQRAAKGTEPIVERLVLCKAAVRWGLRWLSAGSPTVAADSPSLIPLSLSLSVALPAALRELEALIGPELDCGRPDYWCQRAPEHVGAAGLRVPNPQLEREAGRSAALDCKGIMPTRTVQLYSKRPNIVGTIWIRFYGGETDSAFSE